MEVELLSQEIPANEDEEESQSLSHSETDFETTCNRIKEKMWVNCWWKLYIFGALAYFGRAVYWRFNKTDKNWLWMSQDVIDGITMLILGVALPLRATSDACMEALDSNCRVMEVRYVEGFWPRRLPARRLRSSRGFQFWACRPVSF